MSLSYSSTLALQSLFRDKWINLLSILTITSGLIIVSLAFLVVYNLEIATRRLPERFSINIYLNEELSQEKINSIIASLKKNSAVQSVRFISKDEALKELKTTLKDSNYVFEGLDANPLPDALELKLKKSEVGPETARKLADEAATINGVSEVDYGEKFLSTIHYIKVGMKTLGMILVIIVSTGIIFVCYSTVKILFYRRNAEIETYKLLGATKTFIRAPFLIEGALIGLSGGILSLIGMFAFYYMILLKLRLSIPVFNAVLFPKDIFISLPLIGIFLGVTGAMVALGRLKY